MKYLFLLLMSFLISSCDILDPQDSNGSGIGTLAITNKLKIGNNGVSIDIYIDQGNFYGRIKYNSTKSFEIQKGYRTVLVKEVSDRTNIWWDNTMVKIEEGKTKKMVVDINGFGGLINY